MIDSMQIAVMLLLILIGFARAHFVDMPADPRGSAL